MTEEQKPRTPTIEQLVERTATLTATVDQLQEELASHAKMIVQILILAAALGGLVFVQSVAVYKLLKAGDDG